MNKRKRLSIRMERGRDFYTGRHYSAGAHNYFSYHLCREQLQPVLSRYLGLDSEPARLRLTISNQPFKGALSTQILLGSGAGNMIKVRLTPKYTRYYTVTYGTASALTYLIRDWAVGDDKLYFRITKDKSRHV